MRIRRRAQLDPSQIEDRRGMSGGRGVAIGGGGLALVVALVLIVLNLAGGGEGPSAVQEAFQSLSGVTVGAGSTPQRSQDCRTGADAQRSEDCRIVAYVNSIQDYWGKRVRGYRPAPTVFFTNQISTACGQATTQVGPFYCPSDAKVYIDLGFFQELVDRFGAHGGPLAEAYVLAMSTATTSRTSPASSTGCAATARARRAHRSARSCRRTATRGSGPRMPWTPDT